MKNIDIFDYHYLDEMARVGFINDYEIYVMTNDPGKIPHFHIRDKETQGNKFHTCVRIETSEYFHYPGKMDILNSKYRKELVQFLQSKHKSGKFSNWEYLILLWNDNNSNIEVSTSQKMPDYIKLK